MPQAALSKTYYSLVDCHLTYGTLIWGSIKARNQGFVTGGWWDLNPKVSLFWFKNVSFGQRAKQIGVIQAFHSRWVIFMIFQKK